jgi:thiol:disulfide interchange protein DsbD
MESLTFHDPAVVKYAHNNFVTIRVDVTRGGDPVKEEIARRYHIVGVPTVLFLKPGGEERRDLRVMEFMEKDRFLARMAELKNSR